MFVGAKRPRRILISALTLFVARVAADHAQHAFAPHDLAVLTHAFYGRTYFHFAVLCISLNRLYGCVARRVPEHFTLETPQEVKAFTAAAGAVIAHVKDALQYARRHGSK